MEARTPEVEPKVRRSRLNTFLTTVMDEDEEERTLSVVRRPEHEKDQCGLISSQTPLDAWSGECLGER